MLVIHDRHTRPSNFTGLSLVLFLMLSLLSMMAAYEGSKPADELRNNVVASFHEFSTQLPDPESSDTDLVLESADKRLPAPAFHYPSIIVASFALTASKSFYARGPPPQRSAAS